MTSIPLVLMFVTMPLILRIVPRNSVYGLRTWYTLSSDDVWYSSVLLQPLGHLLV